MPNNHIEEDNNFSSWLDKVLSPEERERIAEATRKDVERFERKFAEYILSQVNSETKH